MKKLFICLTILFTCFSQTFAQTNRKTTRKPKPKSPVVVVETRAVVVGNPQSTLETVRRLETFSVVWKTIKDNYFDQTFNGLNWENVRKEYEPRVLASKTDKETYDILQEMINRLNRSHFSIIPPEVYEEIKVARVKSKKLEKKSIKDDKSEEVDKSSDEDENTEFEELFDDENAKYGIGLELRVLNNQFVISSIDKNSAAEKAGLKTGYVVKSVNETSLVYLLERIQLWSPNIKNAKKLLPLEIVSWFLNGEKDTSVNLVFFDENNQEKKLEIKREKLNGEAISIGSDIPKQYLNFQSRALNEQVGYIKFNIFAVPVIEKFCSALSDFKDKKALVIDLRGNVGGLIGALYGITGMLSEKPLDLGTQIFKVGSEKLISRPKVKNFKGKIIILVDNLSISAAEIMSAAMQENDRALIVGDITAGEALPAISVKLPTNAVLLYPIANYKTHKGNFVEGKGVIPNFQVSLDKNLLLIGKDSQLETALKIINENSAFPKNIGSEIATNNLETDDDASPPVVKSTPKPIVTVNNSATPPPPKTFSGPVAVIPKNDALKFIKDEKSQQIIADFIGSIGGEDALRKIDSYTLSGSSILSIKTLQLPVNISIYRQKSDKYSEIIFSEALGEIREVHNGKTYFVQSDFGINQDISASIETSEIEILASINNLLDKNYYKSLQFKGVFEMQGKKVNLIEAVTSTNSTVAMSFDATSKRLLSYATPYMTLSFGNYQKVENVSLPFLITRENLMKIEIDEIKINPKIEDSYFSKKENCYDKAM